MALIPISIVDPEVDINDMHYYVSIDVDVGSGNVSMIEGLS